MIDVTKRNRSINHLTSIVSVLNDVFVSNLLQKSVELLESCETHYSAFWRERNGGFFCICVWLSSAVDGYVLKKSLKHIKLVSYQASTLSLWIVSCANVTFYTSIFILSYIPVVLCLLLFGFVVHAAAFFSFLVEFHGMKCTIQLQCRQFIFSCTDTEYKNILAGQAWEELPPAASFLC